MAKTTQEDFLAELEEAGPDEVRIRLETKFYSDVNSRGPVAREWLLRRDQSAAAEGARDKATSNAEQMRIARSAKNAAWTAAMAAIVAAIITTAMAVIAYLALSQPP